MINAMIAEQRETASSSAAPEIATSMARFRTELNPRSGTSLRLMIGTPSRFSRRARSAMNCRRSGTTWTSTPSRLVASTTPSIFTCSSSGSAT